MSYKCEAVQQRHFTNYMRIFLHCLIFGNFVVQPCSVKNLKPAFYHSYKQNNSERKSSPGWGYRRYLWNALFSDSLFDTKELSFEFVPRKTLEI